MPTPKTLLELSGANLEPANFASASLIFIDFQNEYLQGPLKLPAAGSAVSHAATLLGLARKNRTPIIHVAHKGSAGGLFDRNDKRGQIIEALTPLDNEPVVEKFFPNAFAKSRLDSDLRESGRSEIIVAGFMTHMCVSSTVRAALDFGYRTTIFAKACATRDLPDGIGGTIPAELIHRASIAALSDRFAVIAENDLGH